MKIYIFGYSHSGTTILRKVIGDHSLVDEVRHETHIPPEYKEKEHIVFKSGGLPTEIQRDCKRVMIMKNPWDVMGSMAKRFGPDFTNKHASLLQRYVNHMVYFRRATEDYKVRYEDLFNGGLEGVFNYLGLEYEGPSRRESTQDFPPGTDVSKQQKSTVDTYARRTKQINLPFQNMTGQSAIYLTKECLAKIQSNKTIKSAYHDYEYLSQKIKYETI